eukprot:GFUD01031657.1.p1 GENE.GFUD01031657.1~~GFUD01031657.1.p1  ORF type:complete len:796 (+),score=270.56 GFUD01031657.1:51-2438(+)
MISFTCFLRSILLVLKFQVLNGLEIDDRFEDLVMLRNMVEKSVGENSKLLADLVPDWVQVLVQGYCETGVVLVKKFSAELCLMAMVVGTLGMLHIISSCLARRRWKVPLIKRMAETDKKLFSTNAELVMLQRELVEASENRRKEEEMVKVLDVQLVKVGEELETVKEEVQLKDGRRKNVERQLEIVKESVASSQEQIALSKAEEIEVLEKMNIGEEQLSEKEDLVQRFREQLENQTELMTKYESEMEREVMENENMSKEIEFAHTELNVMKLNMEEVRIELVESNSTVEKFTGKVAVMERKIEDRKFASDQLQSQLEDRTEACERMQAELTYLRSKISAIEVAYEIKEEELQVLQEAGKEEIRKRNGESAEADGWDLDEDYLLSVELEEIKDGAKMRIDNRKHIERNEKLENQMGDLKLKLNEITDQVSQAASEMDSIQEGKNNAIKDKANAERKLEILTEYFNKKEADLNKQLGLQSTKFVNVSSEAESTAKKLVALTDELELTRSQLDMLKKELEDQESSLKAAYLAEVKKALENKIEARQAERRVTEMKNEMKLLRNRLTLVEGRKKIIVALAKEENGIGFNKANEYLPPLPGLPPLPHSLVPSLIPLPSLPGMSSFPHLAGLFPAPQDPDLTSLSSHPTQDTNLSLASRRTRSVSPENSQSVHSQYWTRSPSPGQDRFVPDQYSYRHRTRSPSPERFYQDRNHRPRSPLLDQDRLISDRSQYGQASTRSTLPDSSDYRARYDRSYPDRYSGQRCCTAPEAEKYQARDCRLGGEEGQSAASPTDMQGRNWGV